MQYFYCHFGIFVLTAELSKVLESMYTDVNDDTGVEEIIPEVVQREINKLSIRRATGPDNLSGRVLKMCSVQRCDVFSRLFNLPIISNVIPTL